MARDERGKLLPEEVDPKERIPMSEIPEDYTCPECGKGPFRSEQGYRGHMYAVHDLLYTKRSPRPVKWDFQNAIPTKDAVVLKSWQRLGLAMHVIYGLTYQEVVDRIRGGKGADTLRNVAKSPAGLEWRNKIADALEDPVTLVKQLIQTDSLNAIADHFLAREWARDRKDYQALHKMAMDIGLKSITEPKQQDAVGQAIVVVVREGDTQYERSAKTSYRVLDAELEEEEESEVVDGLMLPDRG